MIGTVTFSPNGEFAFPRSYINRVLLDGLYSPFTVSGGFYTSTISAFPGNHAYIRLAPNFWPWSSNSWTLDHIVTEAYSVNDLSGVHSPTNIVVTYVRPTTPLGSAIRIDVSGFALSPIDGSLPTRDQPYWLPDL